MIDSDKKKRHADAVYVLQLAYTANLKEEDLRIMRFVQSLVEIRHFSIIMIFQSWTTAAAAVIAKQISLLNYSND